jgi:hypothetical protein
VLGSGWVDGVGSWWSRWRGCGWSEFASFDKFVVGGWHWHLESNSGLRRGGWVGCRFLGLGHFGSLLGGDRLRVLSGKWSSLGRFVLDKLFARGFELGLGVDYSWRASSPIWIISDGER